MCLWGMMSRWDEYLSDKEVASRSWHTLLRTADTPPNKSWCLQKQGCSGMSATEVLSWRRRACQIKNHQTIKWVLFWKTIKVIYHSGTQELWQALWKLNVLWSAHQTSIIIKSGLSGLYCKHGATMASTPQSKFTAARTTCHRMHRC